MGFVAALRATPYVLLSGWIGAAAEVNLEQTFQLDKQIGDALLLRWRLPA